MVGSILHSKYLRMFQSEQKDVYQPFIDFIGL